MVQRITPGPVDSTWRNPVLALRWTPGRNDSTAGAVAGGTNLSARPCDDARPLGSLSSYLRASLPKGACRCDGTGCFRSRGMGHTDRSWFSGSFDSSPEGTRRSVVLRRRYPATGSAALEVHAPAFIGARGSSQQARGSRRKPHRRERLNSLIDNELRVCALESNGRKSLLINKLRSSDGVSCGILLSGGLDHA